MTILLSLPFAVFGLNLDTIQRLVTDYGWWGVLLLMFLQGATMPVPNEITMPLAGWLLIQAVGRSALLIPFAGLVGATGWVIGALVAYTVMAIGGRALLTQIRRRFPAADRALARTDAWFARWGAWAVFFARLLPITRTIITLPAGAARMPLVPFTVATFAGAFLWSTFLAAVGYIAGSQWSRVRERLGQWYLPVTIVLVVLLTATYFVVDRIRERRLTREGRSPVSPDAAG